MLSRTCFWYTPKRTWYMPPPLNLPLTPVIDVPSSPPLSLTPSLGLNGCTIPIVILLHPIQNTPPSQPCVHLTPSYLHHRLVIMTPLEAVTIGLYVNGWCGGLEDFRQNNRYLLQEVGETGRQCCILCWHCICVNDPPLPHALSYSHHLGGNNIEAKLVWWSSWGQGTYSLQATINVQVFFGFCRKFAQTKTQQSTDKAN